MSELNHRCRCNDCKKMYANEKAPTELIRKSGCYANNSNLRNGVWYCDLHAISLEARGVEEEVIA